MSRSGSPRILGPALLAALLVCGCLPGRPEPAELPKAAVPTFGPGLPTGAPSSEPQDGEDPGVTTAPQTPIDAGIPTLEPVGGPGLDGRASGIIAALGLPPVSIDEHRTVRASTPGRELLNRFTLQDPAGRRLLLDLTEAGEFRALVRIEPPESSGRIERDEALARAERATRSLGLTEASEPTVSPIGLDGPGWTVDWIRLIDGYAALENGLTVWLRSDGTLEAIRRSANPHEQAPASRTNGAAARAEALRLLSPGRDGVEILDPVLGWVLPQPHLVGNDLDPGRLRLAWAVTWLDATSDGELWFDTADGRLLGGSGGTAPPWRP